jgi:hypothetical protein
MEKATSAGLFQKAYSMRRTSQTSLFALATACSFVIAAAPAAAQDAAPAAPAEQAEAAASTSGNEGLADIVVTATRRSENLQDIPLSVATVGEETLEAVMSGGADIRGLSGRVPSLNIESSFGRTFPRFCAHLRRRLSVCQQMGRASLRACNREAWRRFQDSTTRQTCKLQLRWPGNWRVPGTLFSCHRVHPAFRILLIFEIADRLSPGSAVLLMFMLLNSWRNSSA